MTNSSLLVGQTASGPPSYIQVRPPGADFQGPGAQKHKFKDQKRVILSPLSDLLQTLENVLLLPNTNTRRSHPTGALEAGTLQNAHSSPAEAAQERYRSSPGALQWRHQRRGCPYCLARDPAFLWFFLGFASKALQMTFKGF